MSQKQLQRIKVMENVAEGRLTIRQAAELLQLSSRQAKRLKRLFRAEDVGWLYHGNQERNPPHVLPECVRTEQEGLSVSRRIVRRILRSARIASPQKRRARSIAHGGSGDRKKGCCC